jgi:hypothetical protein
MAINHARKPDLPEASPSELAPPGSAPHIAVAPGVLDREHVLIRAEDDTDEDFERRSQLLAAAVAFARNG